MNDLVSELQHKLKLINKAIDTLAKNGQRMAEAEMNYRIELAKEILIQRDNGVPVTIISDICRGNQKIAKLKFERDTAEVVYQSNLEAIMAWNLEAKMIENQIAREWSQQDE